MEAHDVHQTASNGLDEHLEPILIIKVLLLDHKRPLPGYNMFVYGNFEGSGEAAECFSKAVTTAEDILK